MVRFAFLFLANFLFLPYIHAMKIITKEIRHDTPRESGLFRRIPGPKPIFIDIETTGLSPERARVYLVGCLHPLDDSRFQFLQWLSESPLEERKLLTEVSAYIQDFSPLVHFNGDRFDLPFLQQRADELGIPAAFTGRDSFDIYLRAKKCRTLCALPNCKQKTIEAFLGIHREDQYDGGRLIPVYHEYVKTGDARLEHLLLLHNEEDVTGMLQLLPILSYAGLADDNEMSIQITEEAPSVIAGNDASELLLSFRLKEFYPSRVQFQTAEGWYGILQDHALRMRIPLMRGELRYYLPDPANYYYLPEEDTAIHKSVGEFVDKAYRRQATEKTCYIKKMGCFLPLPENVERKSSGRSRKNLGNENFGKEIFYPDEKKTPYCEYQPELLTDADFWNWYLRGVFRRIR